MAEQKPLKVIIAGAGSAGLLTAHCLKMANIPFVIFEKDENLTRRPRDWNFGIYWAQDALGEFLPPSLREGMRSVQTDTAHVPEPDSCMPVYNAATGDLMKKLPTPWSRRLRRKKWVELLGQGIDIQRGKVLETIRENDDDTVTVTLTDGTQETGDLLIGAEGAHSPTREYLVGKEGGKLIPSDVVASFTLTKLDRETSRALRQRHPRYCVLFHPNGTFAFCSIHDCTSPDPADWLWVLTTTWRSPEAMHQAPQGTAAILDDMRAKGANFAGPFHDAFTGLPDDALAWHSRLSNWPTQPWDSRGGRITLVGDAAHPMTFHRGQGLQNAILDCVSLQQQLRSIPSSPPSSSSSAAVARVELAAAVQRYERELWPRGREAVLASQENTDMVHDWESMLRSPLFTGGVARDATAAADGDGAPAAAAASTASVSA